MLLVDGLIKQGWLKTPEIIHAFQVIKREDFLPHDFKDLAEFDQALPIGFDQTISQPLTVAFMLELLQPQEGNKILDIGSGSGWTTSLLAQIVSQQSKNQKPKTKSQKGKVIGLEIIPELKDFGEHNASKYDFVEKGIAEFVCADGYLGYLQESPFDRILISAETQAVTDAWKRQLKIGGRLVLPIKNSLWLYEKISENEFRKKEYPGFVFVPLINQKDVL